MPKSSAKRRVATLDARTLQQRINDLADRHIAKARRKLKLGFYQPPIHACLRSWLVELLGELSAIIDRDTQEVKMHSAHWAEVSGSKYLLCCLRLVTDENPAVVPPEDLEQIAQDVSEDSSKIETKLNLRESFLLPILEQFGWSKLDLAQQANVDIHTVDNYLNGCKTYASTRKKLSEALGVDVSNLPA